VGFEEGGHTEKVLSADLLVPSPGVPPHTAVLQKAAKKGIPIWSEIELAFRVAQPSLIVAITGTNGKSTTTELVGAILRAWGAEPVVAGNIGRPAIGTVDEVRGRPWVLEVSSFQLLWTEEFHPEIGVWLNFAADHLDYHGTLAAYFAAKARLFSRLEPSDAAVISREILSQISPAGKTVMIEDVELPSGWGEDVPDHLRFNLKAAWAAALLSRLGKEPPPYEILRPVLHQPHRLEYVGEIRGIPFLNDSKGTNAHATCAALRAVPGPVVLILGGRHKRGGYEALEGPLREKVRACVLIGESQEFFAALLKVGDPHGIRFRCLGCAAEGLWTRADGRYRPPFPCLREFRPIPRLRAPGGSLQSGLSKA
jgi:UDP-N-acetylmuramoylalanine--D-glutamate ligase